MANYFLKMDRISPIGALYRKDPLLKRWVEIPEYYLLEKGLPSSSQSLSCRLDKIYPTIGLSETTSVSILQPITDQAASTYILQMLIEHSAYVPGHQLIHSLSLSSILSMEEELERLDKMGPWDKKNKLSRSSIERASATASMQRDTNTLNGKDHSTLEYLVAQSNILASHTEPLYSNSLISQHIIQNEIVQKNELAKYEASSDFRTLDQPVKSTRRAEPIELSDPNTPDGQSINSSSDKSSVSYSQQKQRSISGYPAKRQSTSSSMDKRRKLASDKDVLDKILAIQACTDTSYAVEQVVQLGLLESLSSFGVCIVDNYVVRLDEIARLSSYIQKCPVAIYCTAHSYNTAPFDMAMLEWITPSGVSPFGFVLEKFFSWLPRTSFVVDLPVAVLNSILCQEIQKRKSKIVSAIEEWARDIGTERGMSGFYKEVFQNEWSLLHEGVLSGVDFPKEYTRISQERKEHLSETEEGEIK